MYCDISQRSLFTIGASFLRFQRLFYSRALRTEARKAKLLSKTGVVVHLSISRGDCHDIRAGLDWDVFQNKPFLTFGKESSEAFTTDLSALGIHALCEVSFAGMVCRSILALFVMTPFGRFDSGGAGGADGSGDPVAQQ